VNRWLAGRSNQVRAEEIRDDLLSAAHTGLLRAARHFDPSRGYVFATLAWPIIQQQLWQETKMLDDQVLREKSNTLHGHGDTRRGDNDGEALSMADLIEGREADPADALELDEATAAGFEMMRHLRPRERRIIEYRHAGWKLARIAEHEGISKERIRQVEQQALAKLRGQPLPTKPIARKVRELRRAAGLSQRELSEAAGVHMAVVAMIEQGRCDMKPSTSKRLAMALGCDPKVFLDVAREVAA
jgi:RNA polymerase sigma factor (sigma-70 family)